MEIHLRPTCLIGDQHASSETNNVSLETDMPHWRPIVLIGDQSSWLETNEPHRRPMYLIGDRCTSWRPMYLIRDQCTSSETNVRHRRPTCLIGDPLDMLDQEWQSPLWHVCNRSVNLVSDQACWSPMSLQSNISVSNRSPLDSWWVSNGYPMRLWRRRSLKIERQLGDFLPGF